MTRTYRSASTQNGNGSSGKKKSYCPKCGRNTMKSSGTVWKCQSCGHTLRK